VQGPVFNLQYHKIKKKERKEKKEREREGSDKGSTSKI
jgi:hypothetical protein